MMKHLHKLVASAILFFICNTGFAFTGVGVTLISYTFDTVGYNYTITINARVSNYDSLPFTGIIDFGLHNNTHILTGESLFNKPPYCTPNSISLYPYETVPAVFSIDIDPQFFSPGPDVVVVWPICTKPIIDSIVIDIYVQTPSGIEDDKEELFGFFIMNNKLFLKNYGAQTNFKQVRIYNLLGQQVSEFHFEFITEVPLPNLPKGLYLCELITGDNKRKVIRFFY